MMGHAGIPDMGNPQVLYFGQGFGGKVGKLAHTVFFNGCPRFVVGIGIAEQSGKYLVDYFFLLHGRDCRFLTGFFFARS